MSRNIKAKLSTPLYFIDVIPRLAQKRKLLFLPQDKTERKKRKLASKKEVSFRLVIKKSHFLLCTLSIYCAYKNLFVEDMDPRADADGRCALLFILGYKTKLTREDVSNIWRPFVFGTIYILLEKEVLFPLHALYWIGSSRKGKGDFRSAVFTFGSYGYSI